MSLGPRRYLAYVSGILIALSGREKRRLDH